jgi:hypothetical protein
MSSQARWVGDKLHHGMLRNRILRIKKGSAVSLV